MALKINRDLKNYICSHVVDVISGSCGTAGSATLKIYNGSQPSDADQGTSGTLLCTITNINWGTDWGATTSGTSSLLGTFTGTSGTSGTVGWGRFEYVKNGYDGTSATFRIDGDIGTAASCVFVVNTLATTAGGTITLTGATIYMS